MTRRAGSLLRLGLLATVLALVFLGLLLFADLGGSDTPVVVPSVRVAADPAATNLPNAAPGRAAARLGDEPEVSQAPAPTTAVLRDSARVVGLDTLPQAEFRGRVLDERGRPLGGATVHFVPGHTAYHTLGADIWWAHEVDAADLPRTTTAEDGSFSLDGPTVAYCEDTIQGGAGWGASPGLVVTSPGRTAHPHNCDPIRGEGYDAGDLHLEPEGLLIGRLVDERNEPVPGVTLTWVISELDPAVVPSALVAVEDDLLEIFARTTSDEHGDFRIAGLWQGTGQLRVTGDSVMPTVVEDLVIRSGATTDVGLVQVERGAAIAGRVLDADGRPAAGAEVLVASEDDLSLESDDLIEAVAAAAWSDTWMRRRAICDPDGSFVLGGLNAELLHLVAARAEGQHPVAVRGVSIGGPPVALRLQRQGLLDVTVVDASTGQPVDASRLDAWPLHSGEPEAVALRTEPLPAGQSSAFRVHGAGREATWIAIEAAGYSNHWSKAAGVPEGELATFEIRLEPEHRIVGRVLDEHGEGIAGARIRASRSRTDESEIPYYGWAYGVSDEHGGYALDRIVAGLWDLQVEAEGWLPLREDDVRASPEPQPHDLQMQRAAALEGVVSGHDGLPLRSEELWLFLLDPEGGIEEDWFDESRLHGLYRFDGLQAGEYVLRWSGSRRISLVAGEVQRLDLQQRLGPRLDVRLLGERPVEASPRLSVRSLHDETGLPWGDHHVDVPLEDSRTVLQLPAAGAYLFVVGASDQGGLSGVSEFEADWGEVVARDVSFGSRMLLGKVVSLPDGAPLADAEVLLSAATFGGFRIEARTDVEGGFRFDRLEPGEYRVIVQAAGHQSVEPRMVHVPADTTPEPVELALPREALLRLALHGDAQADQEDSAWLVVFDATREQSVHADYVRFPTQHEVAELLPGRYWLILLDNNFSGPVDWAALAGAMTPVDLLDGQVTEATLRVIRLAD